MFSYKTTVKLIFIYLGIKLKFSIFTKKILICTAGRCLKSPIPTKLLFSLQVQHVINYDFPLNVADYIHRVGRVGRVGSCGGGHVTSLVDTPLGVDVLQRIEMAVR